MRRRVGSRWAGGLAVAAVLALSACGGGGGDDGAGTGSSTTRAPDARTTQVGAFAVRSGAAKGEGTPLGGGLAVARGSTLLGTTFPDPKVRDTLALLLVTGDPVTVFNDYVDQATAAGMTGGPAGGCLPGPSSIACVRTLEDPSDGEALSLVLGRRAGAAGAVSHLGLRYRPPGSLDPADVADTVPSPPTQPVPSVALPASVPVPTGDDWDASVSPSGPALPLPVGVTLAAAPGPCGCAPQGWSAVLGVAGDPEAALRGMAGAFGVDDPTVRRTSKAGRTVLVSDLGLVPGGFAQIRTVSTEDTSWLLVAVARP